MTDKASASANKGVLARRSSTYHLDVAEGQKKVSVEMELVPGDQLPESLRTAPNIARVNLGGRDFYAVMGKTTVVD